jgi:hypothetical protein
LRIIKYISAIYNFKRKKKLSTQREIGGEREREREREGEREREFSHFSLLSSPCQV